MVLPYAGSTKAYLSVVPFAAFGPSTHVARLLSTLMGAFGVYGMARLVEAQLGSRIAVAVGLAIAINPSYIAQTVYDRSGIALWMACLGVQSLVLIRYLRRRTAFSAFCFGIAIGLAVWGRVN